MAVVLPDGDREPKRADEEWVAAALRDMRAFAPLYARYYLPIYRFCRIRLPSAQEAEDATSETFERAMRFLPSYRGPSFRSWLFSIVANVVRNTARDRREAFPLPSGPEPEDVDPSNAPEEAALAREQAQVIQRLLAMLPSTQHRMVELRLVGLTTREISEVLGMSPPAVKVAQWRAFKRLRGLLEGDEGGAERPDA